MLSKELEQTLNDAFARALAAPRVHDRGASAAGAAGQQRRDPRAQGLRRPDQRPARRPGRVHRFHHAADSRGRAGARDAADAGFSSAYCSAPFSTCRARARARSPAPMCWWRSSPSRSRRRSTSSRPRTCRASTWSTSSPTASPRSRRAGREPAGRTRSQPHGAAPAEEGESNPLDSYATNLNEEAEGRAHRSADRPRPRSSASSRCWRGGARTTRCWSVNPASARPRSPRGWPSSSSTARCRRCSRTPWSIPWISARCWPAPSTAAISRSASRAAGGAQAPRGRGAVHRRDPHHHRRRRGLRRRHGRQQPAQAAAELRQAALHRLHHLPGVPRHFRQGQGAQPPLPEDRRAGAQHR
jgi:hypothetical protein